jgi:small subunit ribosomal protein S19
MSRSQKKGPFVDEKVYRKVQKAEAMGSKEPIKTWARACTVIPEFIGYTFLIHDGRKHVKILMTEDMVGHKFGEFAPSRTFKGHSGASKKR